MDGKLFFAMICKLEYLLPGFWKGNREFSFEVSLFFL